jgi:DNA-binding transcriptional LysR family regulator
MKTTLSQIEAFFWITRLGSFHAAAAQLNLTQPTISLRIRALEKALGQALFERAGREMRLTMEGTALLPRAERLMAMAEELSSGAADADPLRGRLRLGAPDSFGLTCLPALLRALREQYRELNVALTIDNSAVLGKMLDERQLDVAFLAEPNLGAHVRTELLGAMEHGWVAGARLRLPRRTLRPEDLAEHEILTNPAPANLMTLVLNWFASAGVAPSRLGTCNSLSVILGLTEAGAGISLLPTAIVAAARAAGTVRILRTAPEIAPPRLFAAYQIDKAGASVRAVLETARAVITRSKLLVFP